MLLDIKLLGDPHLGRTFRNNVPLHRRGEREAMIWQRSEREIRGTEAATHVCLGDLFDAPLVSFDTIWRTAMAYWAAPETTRFVVLQGNHVGRVCQLRSGGAVRAGVRGREGLVGDP
jgi:hypothetical protein